MPRPKQHTTRSQLASLNEPEIEFFILSDRAEAVNGKLYMMGGGWDRIFVNDLNQPSLFSFALGIKVPWNATNTEHKVEITIEDLDRQRPIDLNITAGFVTGRPPWITEGEAQRTILALPIVPVAFGQPGAYQAVARIVGGTERRTEFRVVSTQGAQQFPAG